jgi:hypothetical protein
VRAVEDRLWSQSVNGRSHHINSETARRLCSLTRAGTDLVTPDENDASQKSEVADWLSGRVHRLVADTLAELGAGRGAGDWPLEDRRLLYPALGPAVALAWAAFEGDSEHRRKLAMATVERFIEAAPALRLPRPALRAAYRLPARIQPAWKPGAAISAGALLGWIIVGLDEHLNDSRRRRMVSTLVRCYDEVARATRFNHYINGNYQIPLCELSYFHGRFTGSEAASEAYESRVAFLCHPEQTDKRWEGYGLNVTHAPSQDDWHDAVAHFSEVPGRRLSATGSFDGEYTQLQLDHLLRLWFLNGDMRMLRFANALLNAILPYPDRTTWSCDFKGGSRRQHVVPFLNAAPATLFFHDPRPEITDRLVRAQFSTAVDAEYRQLAARKALDDYHLRGYGLTLLNLMLAASDQLRSKLRT